MLPFRLDSDSTEGTAGLVGADDPWMRPALSRVPSSSSYAGRYLDLYPGSSELLEINDVIFPVLSGTSIESLSKSCKELGCEGELSVASLIDVSLGFELMSKAGLGYVLYVDPRDV